MRCEVHSLTTDICGAPVGTSPLSIHTPVYHISPVCATGCRTSLVLRQRRQKEQTRSPPAVSSVDTQPRTIHCAVRRLPREGREALGGFLPQHLCLPALLMPPTSTSLSCWHRPVPCPVFTITEQSGKISRSGIGALNQKAHILPVPRCPPLGEGIQGRCRDESRAIDGSATSKCIRGPAAMCALAGQRWIGYPDTADCIHPSVREFSGRLQFPLRNKPAVDPVLSHAMVLPSSEASGKNL